MGYTPDYIVYHELVMTTKVSLAPEVSRSGAHWLDPGLGILLLPRAELWRLEAQGL